MIIPAICFGLGVVAMGRTKPKTAVRKLSCLGPRSGLVYAVEDYAETGTVVVRAPGDAAVAQFLRAAVRAPGAVGLLYSHGKGRPDVLALIQKDFGVEPKLVAVKPAAAAAAEPRPAAPSSPKASAASGNASGATS